MTYTCLFFILILDSFPWVGWVMSTSVTCQLSTGKQGRYTHFERNFGQVKFNEGNSKELDLLCIVWPHPLRT